MQLHHLLARQAGVITLGQAQECGISASTVQRWAREGRWRRLHPSVYLVGGHRLTDEARVRAAWLWAGAAGPVITGPAAAYWQQMLPRAPALIDITVGRHTHRRPQPGIVLRRRDLERPDLIKDRNVLVADRPFAALETAVALHDGSTFLDRALQRHLRFPALYRSYCRNVGRHGSSEAGQLITASADRADSAAERLLVKLLRDAGISGWELGYPFGPYRIDLAFPTQRVAIEVDGWAWHVDAGRFRNDRRKGNAITRSGWDLLRYTWHALDGEPTQTIGEITETLALAEAT